MHSSLVIIPTYNERENVANMIRAVLSLPEALDILILDDNSPDGTSEIVRTLQQEESLADRLHLIVRPGKLGLGTAYITGFKWALTHGYDYIFEMDCDFSHPISALPHLLRAVSSEGYDVVTWIPVSDTTAGFVCYRREVLQAMALDDIHFKGYAFQIEMKYTAYCLGFKIKEVPITFVNRKLGSSKMNGSIFGEAFVGVLKLRYWRLFKGFPKRPN